METVATAKRLTANPHEVAAPAVTSDFPGLSDKLATFANGPVQGFLCAASSA